MSGFRGFTLFEVLIALSILSIALVALFRGSTTSLKSAREVSELTTAVIAAESLIKEEIGKGYPESGSLEGTFDENIYPDMKWKKSVEPLDIPFVSGLKLVSVEVEWGKGKKYSLKTIISRY